MSNIYFICLSLQATSPALHVCLGRFLDQMNLKFAWLDFQLPLSIQNLRLPFSLRLLTVSLSAAQEKHPVPSVSPGLFLITQVHLVNCCDVSRAFFCCEPSMFQVCCFHVTPSCSRSFENLICHSSNFIQNRITLTQRFNHFYKCLPLILGNVDCSDSV